jgi:hypothetical protein
MPGNTPGRIAEKLTASMQFFLFPSLEIGMTRLDEEVAKIVGHVLRDEIWLESAHESPAAEGVPPNATRSVLIFEREVLEVRREPSDPSQFQVPQGYVRKEPTGAGSGMPRRPRSGPGR